MLKVKCDFQPLNMSNQLLMALQAALESSVSKICPSCACLGGQQAAEHAHQVQSSAGRSSTESAVRTVTGMRPGAKLVWIIKKRETESESLNHPFSLSPAFNHRV